MPKVTDEYFVNKKKSIIDAAIRVCKSKPAYAVTMRDVIKECGISQGGIYNYFSSVDEIFVEIINQAHNKSKAKHEGEAASIFESGKPPEDIIREYFILIGRAMDDIFDQYRSLIHEIAIIQMQEPARMESLETKPNDDLITFINEVSQFIETHKANGNFRANVSRAHITFLIICVVTSIGNVIMFPDQAKKQLELIGLTGEEYTTAESMMKVLAETVIQLISHDAAKCT